MNPFLALTLVFAATQIGLLFIAFFVHHRGTGDGLPAWMASQGLFLAAALVAISMVSWGRWPGSRLLFQCLLVTGGFFLLETFRHQGGRTVLRYCFAGASLLTLPFLVVAEFQHWPWHQALLPQNLLLTAAACYGGLVQLRVVRSLHPQWNHLSGYGLFLLAAILLPFPFLRPDLQLWALILLFFFHMIAAFNFLLVKLVHGNREKKKKPRITEEQNAFYRDLFHLLPEAVFVCSNEGEILFANRALRALLGREGSETLGPLLEYIQEDERTMVGEAFADVVSGRHSHWRSQCWLTRKDGGTARIRLRIRCVRETSLRDMVVGSIEDISHSMMASKQMQDYTHSLEERIMERNRELYRINRTLARKNEELVELNKSKNIFFANVSHELRTPLVAACGYVEMLLEEKLGPVPDKMRKAFETASRSLERLTNFINNLLDLARLEAYRESINYQKLSLYRAAIQVLAQFAALAQQKGLVLHNDVPEDIPLVCIDPGHLEQLLGNLVSNAVKFTTQGEIRITARPGRQGRVQVRVEDSGPGIAPENRRLVFNRFYQVERRSISREKGTGLGLAIVQEIITSYGGEISVSDRRGGGTVFSFDLPAERKRGKKARLVRRILSVSSNLKQNELIKRFFGSRGFRVDQTDAGLEALDLISTRSYDLVLTDVLLPDLEAGEVCKMVRNSKHNKDTAVYVTTSPLPDQERNALLLAGASGMVTKPFDDNALARVMVDELQPT